MQIVEAIEDGLKSQFDIVRDVQDSRNRVSFIAKNTYDETFVIELHFVRLLYYYERILYGVAKSNDVISTAQKEGRAEGRAEGIAIGEERGRLQATLANAKALIERGVPKETVQQALALTNEQMNEL